MLGTRFHHQGRLPGIGLDCGGLIVCAAREAGFIINDRHGYSTLPHGGMFEQALLEHCDIIDIKDATIGDILLFRFDGDPQHIGIISEVDPMMMIHADASVRRVVEHIIDIAWAKKIVNCYRLNGLNND